jgi:peptide/nickel transport system permease protein
MAAYIIRRLVGMALNLVLATVFIFFMLRLVPGDPSGAVLGAAASPEQVAAYRESHGLNKPLIEQYLDWAGGVLHGDFGNSLRSNLPITGEFFDRLPITIEIVVISFVVTTIFGIFGGIVSATKQDTFSDYGFRTFAILGLAVPQFLLITLLLIVPSRTFGYSPPFGAVKFFQDPLNNLELFVPATVMLAIGGSAGLMRLTRTAFLDVFRQDYMRTARAKGLAERTVVYRHGFRNALPPVLTFAGLQLGQLLNGTVILEQIMNLPGIGQWAILAIRFNDYVVMMAVALWSALLIMTISLIIDLSYAIIDPRIRYS